MDLMLHVIAHNECVYVHALNGLEVADTFSCWPLTHGAYLEFKRSKWYIIDKQSSNGVYHNGRKIKVLTSIGLRHGSSLCLGPPADVSMKFECYFVNSSKNTPTMRNTRQRPKASDAVCSGANCSFKKPCNESESSEESQTNTVPISSLISSIVAHGTTSRTSKNTPSKNDGDKFNEKGQRKDALSAKKQPGRKRKTSVVSEQDAKKSIPVKKRRLTKLEKCKRCSKLEAESSEMKLKIAKLEEYKLKMPVINQKVLAEKLKENSSKLLENLLEDNFTCAICTDVFIKAVSLSCSHTFCEVCLLKCKEQSKLCPMCRTPITLQHKVDIIDKFVDSVMEKVEPEIKKKRDKIIAEREAGRTEQSQQGEDQPQPSTSSSSTAPSERIDNLLFFIQILSRLTDIGNRGEHSDSNNDNSDHSDSNNDNSNHSDSNNGNSNHSDSNNGNSNHSTSSSSSDSSFM